VKYSAEDFSRAGDKYLGRPYSEMDCQRFVELCMADVGYYRDLAGSNAWFRDMDWTGSPEECMRVFGSVPTGALLFILEQDGKEPEKYRKDGIGNASHIGIVTHRNDGAIHSSSSRGCVATSVFKDRTIKNGGWNRIGLKRVFDYGNSVNWILEHGNNGPEGEPGEEDDTVQGIVVAESGDTVKLRQKPSTSCPYYWDIDVGSEITVVEKGPTWCKCIAGGLTGWMMTEFIQFEDDDEPAPDPDIDEDFGDDDINPDETVTIRLNAAQAAAAYPVLQAIMEQIVEQIGRG